MDSNNNRYESSIEDAKNCPKCGGSNIIIRAVLASDGRLMLRKICMECNYEANIPKVQTKGKRTTSTLTNWANAVKYRDGERCRLCGSTEAIEAHHIIPVKYDRFRRFIYDVDNGITLCHYCHEMAHGKAMYDGF